MKTPIPPTHLLVGNQSTIKDYVHTYLKQLLCQQPGCHGCNIDKQVDTHQHPHILWLTPEKSYTREQIAPIFHSISFMVAENSHFFCVIEQADLLTTACANSLLKALEEPPTGYFFILLTDRVDNLLPTIRSRSVITYIGDKSPTPPSSLLFNFFITEQKPSKIADYLKLQKIIDQEKPTEHDTRALIEQLITHYHQTYYHEESRNTPEKSIIEKRINILQSFATHPIMPGSSKIQLQKLCLAFYFQ